MIFELQSKKMKNAPKKPKCIFCKKIIDKSDYFRLCKVHGPVYYRIWPWFRLLAPKFIIRFILWINLK